MARTGCAWTACFTLHTLLCYTVLGYNDDYQTSVTIVRQIKDYKPT